MVTKFRLHQLIDALPDEESETAARFLEDLLREHVSLVVSGAAFFDSAPGQAVLRPDVAPIQDIAELHGDFWPDDERPDEFVNAVSTWRREGSHA